MAVRITRGMLTKRGLIAAVVKANIKSVVLGAHSRGLCPGWVVAPVFRVLKLEGA